MKHVKSNILNNKNFEFLKIVNFYESQIKALDNMLKEVNEKNNNSISTLESLFFQNEFLSKQNMITEIKQNIVNHDYIITKELVKNEDARLEQLSSHNKNIENIIYSFEKDINELSKDFVCYISDKL